MLEKGRQTCQDTHQTKYWNTKFVLNGGGGVTNPITDITQIFASTSQKKDLKTKFVLKGGGGVTNSIIDINPIFASTFQ